MLRRAFETVGMPTAMLDDLPAFADNPYWAVFRWLPPLTFFTIFEELGKQFGGIEDIFEQIQTASDTIQGQVILWVWAFIGAAIIIEIGAPLAGKLIPL